jgi:hypothetical protein
MLCADSKRIGPRGNNAERFQDAIDNSSPVGIRQPWAGGVVGYLRGCGGTSSAGREAVRRWRQKALTWSRKMA